MKRNSINSLLVLAFYAFYSISPLLYGVGIHTPEDHSFPGPAEHVAFFSRHAGTHGLFETASEAKHFRSSPAPVVLLKKKRALVLSLKEIIGNPVLSQETWSDGRSSGFFPVKAPHDRPMGVVCPNGFQFYHSGTSPPSADLASLPVYPA